MPQFSIFRSPVKMMHLIIALSIWVYVVNTNSMDRFMNLDVANPYLTCFGLKEMVAKYQK